MGYPKFGDDEEALRLYILPHGQTWLQPFFSVARTPAGPGTGRGHLFPASIKGLYAAVHSILGRALGNNQVGT